mmetsp:Transcript_15419/g.32175  ORF Transcript_15419/g.32175 Transcript_15419/m.32175 type:complete len:201 (+) Transcript_15419:311-913(+)
MSMVTQPTARDACPAASSTPKAPVTFRLNVGKSTSGPAAKAIVARGSPTVPMSRNGPPSGCGPPEPHTAPRMVIEERAFPIPGISSTGSSSAYSFTPSAWSSSSVALLTSAPTGRAARTRRSTLSSRSPSPSSQRCASSGGPFSSVSIKVAAPNVTRLPWSWNHSPGLRADPELAPALLKPVLGGQRLLLRRPPRRPSSR